MTPEQWQRVKEVFYAAIERPAEGRETFLVEACGADAALRRDVAALIADHERAGSFLDQPPHVLSSSVDGGGTSPLIGRRIGPYEVLAELGRGGMGAVYLAARADDVYEKKVALKIVKSDSLTNVLVRRFRGERQILANLDHANIARIVDGGATDDGLPYLVMEYVDGLPIDAYCDARAFSIGDRLRLFRAVCAAVQYAHQNLVVHRDLKPSNILVTADGTPKLLDFGIAKLLGGDGGRLDATVTGARMFTPEYASPEQVRGEPISTSVDVYALGVVLYRLVTGQRPYRVETELPHELARAICEQDTPVPSSVAPRKKLDRDVDTIILKALQKDPARRYASVEQLSEDIRRHLESLPVLAHRDSVSYFLRKFAARHRAGVAAAALALLALVGGSALIVWQARAATAQRARAERRFNDVRNLANSFLFEFHDAIRTLPGSTPARELVVKKALEYLDGLAIESGDDRSLQLELAAAYDKVGDVQGELYAANLGQTEKARESYSKGLALREAAASKIPGDVMVQRSLASSYTKLGSLLWVNGNPAGAADLYGKALAIDQQLASKSPNDRELAYAVATDYTKLGLMQGASGKTDDGLQNCQTAIVLLERLADAAPTERRMQEALATAYDRLGQILEGATERKNEGLLMYRKTLKIREALAADEALNTDRLRAVAASHTAIGDVLLKIGDFSAAVHSHRTSLTILEELSAADPANVQFSGDVEAVRGRLGAALTGQGNHQAAIPLLQTSLARQEELLRIDPSSDIVRFRIATTQQELGTAECALAAERTRPASQRMQFWREGRSHLRTSLDALTAFRNRGAITGDEAAKVDQAAASFATCDVGVTGLSK